MVSSHSKNLKAAAALTTWLTTSDDNLTAAPTYPAYSPGAKAWLANPANKDYFADRRVRPVPAGCQRGVDRLGQHQVQRRHDWSSIVLPAVTAGKTLTETLARLAERDRRRGQVRRIHGDHEVTSSRHSGCVPARRGTVRRAREGGLSGPLFVSGYVVLLLAFGVLPTLYAVYLAFTNVRGQFTGLNQFHRVVQDYRFGRRSATSWCTWCSGWLLIVVLTVGVAIVLRSRMPARLSAALRFLYYIPGALAGVASVLVWLFMLDPSVSPVNWLLQLARASPPSPRCWPPATCR